MKIKKILAFCLTGMAAVLSAGCSNVVWAGSDGTQEEIKVRKVASNRLEAILEEGAITIGISPDYAPFAFPVQADGEEGHSLGGSDVELGKYIAAQLGVEADFCEMEFEDALNAVSEKEVDLVLLGMLPEADRKALMDFTDVYYEPGKQVVLMQEKQAESIKTLEDLEGKTVAAQYGSLQAQLAVEQLPGSYLELTDHASEAVLELRMGTVDGAVLDETVAKEAASEYTGLTILEDAFTYTSRGIVGGVVQGEEELLNRINEILAGVLEENRYLNWLDEATSLARAS